MLQKKQTITETYKSMTSERKCESEENETILRDDVIEAER